MKTSQLQEVISWLRTTDLVEVSFRKGREGFALSTAQAGAPAPRVPASRYAAVCSPRVGLFQFGEPGQARKAEEGAAVREGEALGIVESGRGSSSPVKAPCAGRLTRVFIEGGSPVEYGQPLFFIEPTA